MAEKKTFIGEHDGKEYYWDPETLDLVWRVPDIRETIRARPGYKILAADYSQVEVKIMGFLSQDPDLIAAINSGKDIHSYIATEIFGTKLDFTYELMELARKDSTHARYKELSGLRSKTKTTTFGVPYGAGPSKVALMTGMSIDEANDFINAYMGRYPGLAAWLINQGESAIINGFTTSLGGRKRFYNIPSPDNRDYEKIISQIKRWAGNHPIQATNADMLKMALRDIYLEIRGGKAAGKPLLSGRIKLVVHDEIVMEWLESEVEIGKEMMERLMNKSYYALVQGVNNKIDVVVSDSWEKA